MTRECACVLELLALPVHRVVGQVDKLVLQVRLAQVERSGGKPLSVQFRIAHQYAVPFNART